MIALIGTTIERNVTSSRMKARLSTNANTIGRWDFIVSRKSFEKAVSPPTAVSVPATLLMVVGTTSSRRASSEASEAASLPLPSMARATMATVLSGLISTDVGSCSLPVAIACSWRSAMPASTVGRGDVLGLDDGDGRHAAARERGVDAVDTSA